MKHTKAIVSSVVALALTAGISATALATNSVNDVDSQPIAIVESNSETTVKEYGSLAETLTPFELAIMMGETPEHPDGRRYPLNRTIDVEDDALSVTEPTMSLKRNTNITAYNYWVGNFILNDGQNISTSFSQPETFTCYVDTHERSGTISAKANYYGNYKQVKISTTYLSYDKNGKEKYEYTVRECKGTEPIRSPEDDNYTGTGKMVEIMYFFSLRDGTGSGAALRDYAVVHFVTESYSKSAAFAAEPYSGLIDTYTYVPEEMFE